MCPPHHFMNKNTVTDYDLYDTQKREVWTTFYVYDSHHTR